APDSATCLAPLGAAQAPNDDPYAPIAFLDDAQVVHLVAEKRAAEGEGLGGTRLRYRVQSAECWETSAGYRVLSAKNTAPSPQNYLAEGTVMARICPDCG